MECFYAYLQASTGYRRLLITAKRHEHAKLRVALLSFQPCLLVVEYCLVDVRLVEGGAADVPSLYPPCHALLPRGLRGSLLWNILDPRKVRSNLECTLSDGIGRPTHPENRLPVQTITLKHMSKVIEVVGQPYGQFAWTALVESP
eukprot:2272535-Pyramimonas_sp.AAC.1